MSTTEQLGREQSSIQAAGSTKLNRPLRVMHILSVSIPHINGYALRSKYIVETQAESGTVEPCVVSSPFYPGLKGTAEDSVINGVPYYRVASPQDKGMFRDLRLMPFVILHGLKKFVNWSVPALRRARRNSIRWAKRTAHRTRRFMRRCIGFAARAYSRLKRISLKISLKIEANLEPIIGEKFTNTVRKITKSAGAMLWLIAYPAINSARWLVRNRSKLSAAVSRFVRSIFRSAQKPMQDDGVPLRQRLIAYLQNVENDLLLKLFQREIVRISQDFKPDVIHVHSPYFCGVPAVKAGQQTNIPVVYEVRGIWEESGVAQGNFQRDSDVYRMWRRNETWAMQNADAVTCICDELKKEIISRGVSADRVFVAANAVDSEVFKPNSSAVADSELPEMVRETRAKLRGVTMGYIGSIRPLEGVDGLVRGAAEAIHRGYDVTLLVVGGGKGIDELQALAEELGIGERAVFTGQVPHDEVQFYYEMIDVFIISRPASRVAKLVTPLKPLEAMAMEKALVVSDLPALRELVTEGKTGLIYHAENAQDLANQCGRLIEDEQLRSRLEKTAREWVVSERSWSHTVAPQLEAYAKIVPGFSVPEQPAAQPVSRAA